MPRVRRFWMICKRCYNIEKMDWEEMQMEQQDTWELARQLVQFDSSDPGAYEGQIGGWIYEWLKDRAAEAGLAVDEAVASGVEQDGMGQDGTEQDGMGQSAGCIQLRRMEVLPGRSNVMARIPGTKPGPALIYICHMDTVMLGDGWDEDTPPLGAVVRDGRLYGRGACDMKSGLACALTAFSKALGRIGKTGKWPERSMAFIGTVDEEDFMRGVEAAVRSGWVTDQDWILDTEPTDGQIQVAHKGRTWFELTMDGITAHASNPWKGADAIAAMAESISLIRRRIAACPIHHDLGRSTVTFGQITGGYRPYVVPDSCKVWIDMRLVPPTDTAAARAVLDEAVRAAEEAVPGVRGSYVVTGDRPYVEKDDGSLLLESLRSACRDVTGQEVQVGSFNGYTDTAVIAGTLNNHNCMSYGPGSLELAHKPNEWVPFEDVTRCQKVLWRLAETVVFGDL